MTDLWVVTKTVTEYHKFTIKAHTKEKALELAEDDTTYYCDPANAYDTIVEVQSAWAKRVYDKYFEVSA